MGKLADDMIRLSQEIQSLRAERHAFVEELKTDVANLRSEFRKEHTAMARETRAQRQAIIDDLRAAQRAWSELGTPLTDSRRPAELSLTEEELALQAETDDTTTRQSKKTKKQPRRRS